jgi:methylmalonyl-CoA mutase N-terminal domain/subunit
MEQTGISQIFDSSRLTGATSVEMSMLSDALMATRGLMPQVEAFVNERIQMEYPNSTAYIKFIDVTTYDKKDRINTIKEAASLGLPVKQEYMTLIGYDPLEAMAADWLETKLGMAVTTFVHPLVSSHIQSGDSSTGGAPKKKDGDLSDAGKETKDKEKNKK